MDIHLSGWLEEDEKTDRKNRILLIVYTENGTEWMEGLFAAFSKENQVVCCVHAGTKKDGKALKGRLKGIPEDNTRLFSDLGEILEEEYSSAGLIVFIASAGTAVRELAPFLQKDPLGPAVLVMDDLAVHVISLISGRVGGANGWCREVAAITGAEAVITTASDLHGRFSASEFAAKNQLKIEDEAMVKEIRKRVLRGQAIGIYSDFPMEGRLPKGILLIEKSEKRRVPYAVHPECGIVITFDPDTPKQFEVECRMFPMRKETEEDGFTVAYSTENMPRIFF